MSKVYPSEENGGPDFSDYDFTLAKTRTVLMVFNGVSDMLLVFDELCRFILDVQFLLDNEQEPAEKVCLLISIVKPGDVFPYIVSAYWRPHCDFVQAFYPPCGSKHSYLLLFSLNPLALKDLRLPVNVEAHHGRLVVEEHKRLLYSVGVHYRDLGAPVPKGNQYG